jgi:uncharacterized protein
MSQEIPDSVDLERLTQAGVTLEGRIAAARLGRLREAFAQVGDATVRLSFARDPGDGKARLHGVLKADVHTTCQRCLGPLHLALEAGFEWHPDEEEAADPASPACLFDLLGLLEDELLLACPMIPRHANDACTAAMDAEADIRRGRPKPFDALAALRQNIKLIAADPRADPQSEE